MKKINILGLGKSLEEYKITSDETIGVNDVNKFFPVDNLVVVDPPRVFESSRLQTIINTKPKKFYSNVVEWQTLTQNFQLMKFDLFPGCLQGLDNKEVVCYSNNSAFVAAVVAYKMGAKEIVLYGVDLVNHPALSQPTMLKKQLLHFRALHQQLNARGVKMFVCSKYSKLSEFMPVAPLN